MPAKITDRYSLELDCRAKVRHWADLYEHGVWYHALPTAVDHWRGQTTRAMNHIFEQGIDICWWHKIEEPYATAEEMADRVLKSGVFIVRPRRGGSHPLGPTVHTLFRVVHDWYGHILEGNAFTMDGELAAFKSHAETKLFSKDVLPLVWSEVVLENAYRLYHGHWHYISKPVFDPHWGEDQ